jgi:hypothetical protein
MLSFPLGGWLPSPPTPSSPARTPDANASVSSSPWSPASPLPSLDLPRLSAPSLLPHMAAHSSPFVAATRLPCLHCAADPDPSYGRASASSPPSAAAPATLGAPPWAPWGVPSTMPPPPPRGRAPLPLGCGHVVARPSIHERVTRLPPPPGRTTAP